MPKFDELFKAEMMALFGHFIATGIGRFSPIEDNWRKGITFMPWFSSVMTCKRIRLFVQYFHLANNEEAVKRNHPNYSKLFKLESLHTTLSNSFRSMFHPDQADIDEQMIGTKYHVSFIQNMPKKPKNIWSQSMYTLRVSHSLLCRLSNLHWCFSIKHRTLSGLSSRF